METRRSSMLCLVVIGLVGCSGIAPPDAAFTHPEGYNESGLTDPEVAADQHRSALSEHDTHTERMSLTSPKYDGFVETTIRSDNTDNRAVANMRINRSGETFLNRDLYHDGTTGYAKTEVGEVKDTYTTSNSSLAAFRDHLVNTSEIDGWLANVSFEETGTVTRDDETLLRYNATEVDDREAFFYTTEFSTIDSVESVDSTLLIDEEGIIRSFNVTVTYTFADQTRNGTISYRVTDIDSTTVEEPDWLDAAESAATEDDNPFENGLLIAGEPNRLRSDGVDRI